MHCLRLAPEAEMIGEWGCIRPCLERYVCILRLWNRLIDMHDDRITKAIFRWALNAQNVWATVIRQIFNSLDLDANFDSLLPCDIDIVKLKINDLAREAREQEIVTKPKLRTYSTFKATFATENYVIKNVSRRKRSLFCQLCIGILPSNWNRAISKFASRGTALWDVRKLWYLCAGVKNIKIYVMCYILKQLTSRMNFPIWIQMQNSITLCVICGGV